MWTFSCIILGMRSLVAILLSGFFVISLASSHVYAQTVNLSEYITGYTGAGDNIGESPATAYSLSTGERVYFANEASPQTPQIKTLNPRKMYKNSNYEQLFYGAEGIYRREDVSWARGNFTPAKCVGGETAAYTLEITCGVPFPAGTRMNSDGAIWAPASASVGDSWNTQAHKILPIIRSSAVNGERITCDLSNLSGYPSQCTSSTQQLAAYFEPGEKTFCSGATNDAPVIEIRTLSGPGSGEVFYFMRGYGLVGYQDLPNNPNFEAAISGPNNGNCRLPPGFRAGMWSFFDGKRFSNDLPMDYGGLASDSFSCTGWDSGTGQGVTGGDDSKVDNDWACIGTAVGEYVRAVLEDPRTQNLTHIRMMSPTFNLTSPYFEEIYNPFREAVGDDAFAKLDLMSGNSYNTDYMNVEDGFERLAAVSGGKPIYLPEFGWYRTPDRDRLRDSIDYLRGHPQFEGGALFNGFDTNPDFSFHAMDDDTINYVRRNIRDRIGVNTGRFYTSDESVYQRAEDLGLASFVEIANNDNDRSFPSLLPGIDRAHQGGMTAVLRIGLGDSSGGFDDPGDMAAFLQDLDNAVGGPVLVAIGPNEPVTESWASPECDYEDDVDDIMDWTARMCSGATLPDINPGATCTKRVLISGTINSNFPNLVGSEIVTNQPASGITVITYMGDGEYYTGKRGDKLVFPVDWDFSDGQGTFRVEACHSSDTKYAGSNYLAFICGLSETPRNEGYTINNAGVGRPSTRTRPGINTTPIIDDDPENDTGTSRPVSWVPQIGQVLQASDDDPANNPDPGDDPNNDPGTGTDPDPGGNNSPDPDAGSDCVSGDGSLSLEPSYEPSGLVDLEELGAVTRSGKTEVTADAAEYIMAFIEEAESMGYIIGVDYGYRSYSTQERLHIDNPDGSAEAGASQHQTGTAVDLYYLPNGNWNNFQEIPAKLLPVAEKNGLVRPLSSDPPHFVAVDAIEPGLIKLFRQNGLTLIDPSDNSTYEAINNAIMGVYCRTNPGEELYPVIGDLYRLHTEQDISDLRITIDCPAVVEPIGIRRNKVGGIIPLNLDKLEYADKSVRLSCEKNTAAQIHPSSHEGPYAYYGQGLSVPFGAQAVIDLMEDVSEEFEGLRYYDDSPGRFPEQKYEPADIDLVGRTNLKQLNVDVSAYASMISSVIGSPYIGEILFTPKDGQDDPEQMNDLPTCKRVLDCNTFNTKNEVLNGENGVDYQTFYGPGNPQPGAEPVTSVPAGVEARPGINLPAALAHQQGVDFFNPRTCYSIGVNAAGPDFFSDLYKTVDLGRPVCKDDGGGIVTLGQIEPPLAWDVENRQADYAYPHTYFPLWYMFLNQEATSMAVHVEYTIDDSFMNTTVPYRITEFPDDDNFTPSASPDGRQEHAWTGRSHSIYPSDITGMFSGPNASFILGTRVYPWSEEGGNPTAMFTAPDDPVDPTSNDQLTEGMVSTGTGYYRIGNVEPLCIASSLDPHWDKPLNDGKDGPGVVEKMAGLDPQAGRAETNDPYSAGYMYRRPVDPYPDSPPGAAPWAFDSDPDLWKDRGLGYGLYFEDPIETDGFLGVAEELTQEAGGWAAAWEGEEQWRYCTEKEEFSSEINDTCTKITKADGSVAWSCNAVNNPYNCDVKNRITSHNDVEVWEDPHQDMRSGILNYATRFLPPDAADLVKRYEIGTLGILDVRNSKEEFWGDKQGFGVEYSRSGSTGGGVYYSDLARMMVGIPNQNESPMLPPYIPPEIPEINCDTEIAAPAGHNVKPVDDLLAAIPVNYRNNINEENVRACYNAVIAAAVSSGNDPAFFMAVWLEESGASNYEAFDNVADFGCAVGSWGREDFNDQIRCMSVLQNAYATRDYPDRIACRAKEPFPGSLTVDKFLQIYSEGDTGCAGSTGYNNNPYFYQQIQDFYSVSHINGACLATGSNDKVLTGSTNNWSGPCN